MRGWGKSMSQPKCLFNSRDHYIESVVECHNAIINTCTSNIGSRALKLLECEFGSDCI